MTIDVIALAATTCVTGIVGYLVKAVLDSLKQYTDDSAKWRHGLDGKIDALTDATQTTMRTQLLHMSEKYLTRGWVTPEERAALCDMHAKYAALHANGYIDGYMARVAQLPDREI